MGTSEREDGHLRNDGGGRLLRSGSERRSDRLHLSYTPAIESEGIVDNP